MQGKKKDIVQGIEEEQEQLRGERKEEEEN